MKNLVPRYKRDLVEGPSSGYALLGATLTVVTEVKQVHFSSGRYTTWTGSWKSEAVVLSLSYLVSYIDMINLGFDRANKARQNQIKRLPQAGCGGKGL